MLQTSDQPKPSCNNPKGKNQYTPIDDPRIPEILRTYQRRGISDRRRLRDLIRDDHGIIMSESTIARRRRELGLRASGLTTRSLPDAVKRQLVLDQMAKDPEGKLGAVTIKAKIFKDTGIDITRDWIREEMRVLAPTAFVSRRPHHKNSPAPQQSTSTSTSTTVTFPDPPAHPQPASRTSGSTSSGPSPSRRARRTIRQTVQNTNAIAPLPSAATGTSRPRQTPPPSHVDLYENDPDSGANSPLFSPPRSAIPSPRPTSLRVDTAPSECYPPLIDIDIDAQPQPIHHPPPITSTPTSSAPASAPPPTPTPHPNPNPNASAMALNAITQTTPKLISLTHSLSHLVPGPDAYAYDSVMKCMEAAAMLERQLARIATGLRA